ncbi:MAG TPA: AAA family ATPase [Streptosporangiaceae bacterium]|nr:AAA family ATPase [Streptosporangiaceae bacterium]
MARALQPSVVVVEDVELLAGPGEAVRGHPELARLLHEMDGLSPDASVTFLLTAGQADALEEALAARPGRIDHTARLPLPDAAARRRLLRLLPGPAGDRPGRHAGRGGPHRRGHRVVHPGTAPPGRAARGHARGRSAGRPARPRQPAPRQAAPRQAAPRRAARRRVRHCGSPPGTSTGPSTSCWTAART